MLGANMTQARVASRLISRSFNLNLVGLNVSRTAHGPSSAKDLDRLYRKYRHIQC